MFAVHDAVLRRVQSLDRSCRSARARVRCDSEIKNGARWRGRTPTRRRLTAAFSVKSTQYALIASAGSCCSCCPCWFIVVCFGLVWKTGGFRGFVGRVFRFSVFAISPFDLIVQQCNRATGLVELQQPLFDFENDDIQ